MKNSIIITLAMLIATSNLFSQNLPIPSKWKVKKYGITYGFDTDMVDGMDGNYLLSTGKDVNVVVGEDVNFRDMYSGVCENPHLRFTAALEVPKLRNTELQIGVNAFFNRVDGAYYSNNDFNQFNNINSDYISVSTISHEFGFEGALVKRLNLGFINLYGGLGTNLGYSIGDQLQIEGNNLESVNQNMNRSNTDIASGRTYSDHTYHTFEAKDAFHQRAFLQAGISLLFFKRLELGLDYRDGVGYKAVLDGPITKTRLHSIGFTTKWVLR